MALEICPTRSTGARETTGTDLPTRRNSGRTFATTTWKLFTAASMAWQSFRSSRCTTSRTETDSGCRADVRVGRITAKRNGVRVYLFTVIERSSTGSSWSVASISGVPYARLCDRSHGTITPVDELEHGFRPRAS